MLPKNVLARDEVHEPVGRHVHRCVLAVVEAELEGQGERHGGEVADQPGGGVGRDVIRGGQPADVPEPVRLQGQRERQRRVGRDRDRGRHRAVAVSGRRGGHVVRPLRDQRELVVPGRVGRRRPAAASRGSRPARARPADRCCRAPCRTGGTTGRATRATSSVTVVSFTMAMPRDGAGRVAEARWPSGSRSPRAAGGGRRPSRRSPSSDPPGPGRER